MYSSVIHVFFCLGKFFAKHVSHSVFFVKFFSLNGASSVLQASTYNSIAFTYNPLDFLSLESAQVQSYDFANVLKRC